jgi:hypothetical protein
MQARTILTKLCGYFDAVAKPEPRSSGSNNGTTDSQWTRASTRKSAGIRRRASTMFSTVVPSQTSASQ